MEYILPSGFINRMEWLLEAETPAFLDGYSRPLQRGLRVNPLKCPIHQFLDVFPQKITPAPFSSCGFYLEEGIRAGADPLHHAGAYYMQEPSAMSAVTVLDPKPGERVLDLCAAPGGKSTQIAAALQGRGLLWSNEVIRSRAQILAQNLERCGVHNAVISSTGAAGLCSRLTGYFDAVLVDAPCSGEGMFRKEPAALEQWSESNIRLCAARQEEILFAAAHAVATGGRLVYSTCTFAPEENECLIARFLAAHPEFELADTGAVFGRPGFDWAHVKAFASSDSFTNTVNYDTLPLHYTRRILPNDGGEGHFVALMVRRNENNDCTTPFKAAKKDTSSIDFVKLYGECFSVPMEGIPCTIGKLVRLLPEGLPDLGGLGVLSAGVAAAELCKNRQEPCHALYMAASSVQSCISSLDFTLNDPRLAAFLHGESIEAPDCRGWTAVAVHGIVTGFGKASGGILKNRYPKGLRLLN